MHPVVLEYKKEVDRYTTKIQNGLLSYMFLPRGGHHQADIYNI